MKKQAAKSNGGRVMSLEGLRGVAAIMVVLSHLVVAFYPIIDGGLGGGRIQHTPFEDNLYGTPLTVFTHGVFAVAIFFALSGFVLSIGFFESGRESIIKKLAAKRYFRLAIPVVVAVLGVWLVVKLGLYHINEAGAISGSGWSTYSLSPTIFGALYQGFIGSFFEGAHTYNTVLWTMIYEFSGSFMVFVILFFAGKTSRRYFVYFALALLLLRTWYLPFVLGMAIADFYANNKAFFKSKIILGVGLLIGGAIFGGYPNGAVNGTFYQYFIGGQTVYLSLGAIMVLMSVLMIPMVSRFLEKVSILGKYTFSLYLTHIPIIYSLTAGMFLILVNVTHWGYNRAVIGAFLVSLPVFIAVSWLFEKYVDMPSIKLSGMFADWFFKKESK